MNPSRNTKRALWALLLSWASLAYPACVGTPLPDPPSFASALINGTPTPQADTLRLVGHTNAIHPGGITIRITTPPSPGMLVSVNADGSFGRIVPGAVGTTFYVEIIDADGDHFVGAYVAQADTTVVAASAGPDTDGDGTPDAIDCAVNDATMSGQRCVARACSTDADCASGLACVAGVCQSTGCVPQPEVCNGVDDDCDGVIDNGDPNGGVQCMIGGGCGVVTCSGTPMCMMVVTPARETCGNGIDDDCNGIIDDGCH